MTVIGIVSQELKKEILFPEDFPFGNPADFGEDYVGGLAKRFNKQSPKFRYSRSVPKFEDLVFYQDIPVEEDEDRDRAAAEKVLEIFQKDREAIVGVMQSIGFESLPNFIIRPNLRRLLNIFDEIHRYYLDSALQVISRERGNGSYVITTDEIPGLDPEEGMRLLIEQIEETYRSANNIPKALSEPDVIEPTALGEAGTPDLSTSAEAEEERTLEQEKQELARQVEEIITGGD